MDEGERERGRTRVKNTFFCEKFTPAPLSISFSMCSGLPWKADHMRGVIMAPSLKLPSRPGTCMGIIHGVRDRE